jgi:hypothetical protein
MQCAVIKINKNMQNQQVVFRRIENYAKNVHNHHVRIPVNLSKIIETPTKAMQHIRTYLKDVYEQSTQTIGSELLHAIWYNLFVQRL